jgi:LPXTG-motif cell wall-anchored protein
MTRRAPHSFLAALAAAFLVAAAPLAAQTTDPSDPAETPELGERVERTEEGSLQGDVVLLDADNLILETAEGDRAFSIAADSVLPAEVRDADDWASFRGVPVRVTFVPGAEGELRVVRTLTLVGESGSGDEIAATPERPFTTRTDLADQSDVVEPEEIEPTAGATGEAADTMPRAERTTAAEIAAANPDEPTANQLAAADELDEELDEELDAAAALDDDELPPPADTMASLPATGSALPWLGLIGTLALVAALTVGALERRRRRAAPVAAARR